MNLEDLKELIKITEPSYFCQEYFFDESMWYFDDASTEVLPGVTYTKFKALVAKKVGADSKDIALGGSAKFGFSLNPDERQEKLFRKFNDDSDLDLIIVDPKLFEATWKSLKEAFYNDYYWVMNKHSRHIFRGFIFLDDKTNYHTKYLKEIQSFMRDLSADLISQLGISRELKYRIYGSWNDAHIYHTMGMLKIQKVLSDVT